MSNHLLAFGAPPLPHPAPTPTLTPAPAPTPHVLLAQGWEGGACESPAQLRFFKLFKRKYIYSVPQKIFKPLDAMPAHLPKQILSALDALHSINTAGSLSA